MQKKNSCFLPIQKSHRKEPLQGIISSISKIGENGDGCLTCFVMQSNYFCGMKKLFFFASLLVVQLACFAQCSMCTKTAQQLGEKPASGLNSGILYLMFAPFAIVGFVGYRWWKGQKNTEV